MLRSFIAVTEIAIVFLQLDEVRNKLRTLRRGYYLVLHGMIGCGKSCLAAEALNHDIILDVFKVILKIHMIGLDSCISVDGIYLSCCL